MNIFGQDNPREHLAHVAPVKYNLVQVNTCSTDLENGNSKMACRQWYTVWLAQPGSLDTVSENAASNKEDILMQSQMFRTTDKAAFIGSQKTEIEGLQKFVVMDLHHISDLPPWACLLSSIWSYRRK